MEPTCIFSAINATKSIAEYLGLVESINSDIKALLHQSFMSAKMNLEYAKDATSKNQREYIFEAKNKFIEAIAVETGYNLVTSYLGLATCQFLLGDIFNARKSLENIRSVELPKMERNRAIASDIFYEPESFIAPFPLFNTIFRGIGRLYGAKGLIESHKENELEKYKSECLKCLELKQLEA